MRFRSTVFLVLLAACAKDPTALAGLDPTVSFKNASPYPVAMDWYAQSGLKQHTRIARGDSVCITFTSTTLTDSVRFVVDDSTYRPINTGWQMLWSPWFDPRTGIPTAGANEYPYGTEYWVFVWGGLLGPAYGADSLKYATTLPKAPC